MYPSGSGESEISEDDAVELADVGAFFLNKLCLWLGGRGLNSIRLCESESVGRLMFELALEPSSELMSPCRVIKDDIIMIHIQNFFLNEF